MKNVLLIFLSFFLVSSAQAGLEGAESFEVCAKYQRSIFSWSDEFDGQAYLKSKPRRVQRRRELFVYFLVNQYLFVF